MNIKKVNKVQKEYVAKLGTGVDNLYVFPVFGRPALSRVESAVSGGEPLFMKAYETNDRRGAYRYVNIRRVDEIVMVKLDVPADIKALYDVVESADWEESEDARLQISNYFSNH